MTTPRDLLIVAMDMPSSRTVERGDLSLALAGAELIDLLAAEAAEIDAAGRIVPAYRRALPDPLLDQADAALLRGQPYEPAGEWLWRRGRGLSVAYLDALESEGLLNRERHRHWLLFSSTQVVLVDSAARRRAAHRWNADEPVLAALAATIGIDDRRSAADDLDQMFAEPPAVTNDAVVAVLDAVTDAVAELADERVRRARRLDDATADNVRRGY